MLWLMFALLVVVGYMFTFAGKIRTFAVWLQQSKACAICEEPAVIELNWHIERGALEKDTEIDCN